MTGAAPCYCLLLPALCPGSTAAPNTPSSPLHFTPLLCTLLCVAPCCPVLAVLPYRVQTCKPYPAYPNATPTSSEPLYSTSQSTALHSAAWHHTAGYKSTTPEEARESPPATSPDTPPPESPHGLISPQQTLMMTGDTVSQTPVTDQVGKPAAGTPVLTPSLTGHRSSVTTWNSSVETLSVDVDPRHRYCYKLV